jgi:hypothetical protein
VRTWKKSPFSSPSASEEGYENDEDPEEEEDALGEVWELIKSLSAQLDRWEVERCAEDFSVLEEDVLGGSFEEDIEDFIGRDIKFMPLRSRCICLRFKGRSHCGRGCFFFFTDDFP